MGKSFVQSHGESDAAQQCAASVQCADAACCVEALAADVPVVVVTGHYGVGKTNFSLNLALDAAAAGREVTLIDLDVVNPYFRSSEYREQMEEAGVRVIAPVFAERGSNLDVPSLTGAIAPAIQMTQHAWSQVRAASGCAHQASSARAETSSGRFVRAQDCLSDWALPEAAPCAAPLVIIDAGGDDAGATVLARFAPTIKKAPYRLVYVVNRFRTLTQEAEEAVRVLREIEEASNLEATAIVGNSHIMGDTDEVAVLAGVDFAREVAQGTGLPLMCATYPASCIRRENLSAALENDACALYPVRIYVRTPWDARV